MTLDLTHQREEVRALVEQLTPHQLDAVQTLLEVMIEPIARTLALSPIEDEELTPETIAAIDIALASLSRGEGIPHEEIRKEFGLSS